jgi:hypothetical protein
MHIAFVCCVIKVDVSRVIHPLTPHFPLQKNIPIPLNRDKVRSQEQTFFCVPWTNILACFIPATLALTL